MSINHGFVDHVDLSVEMDKVITIYSLHQDQLSCLKA